MAKNDNHNEKTDEELIQLTIKDQEFFVYLIRRYEGKLSRYIRRISNAGKEDIEDILQEVFIKVYQNIYDFNSDLKFSSWVYRITHNQVIDFYRKNKARPQTINFDGNVWEEIASKVKSEFDLEKEIDNKFLENDVKTVFSKLDKKYKEVLILKFIEEKDYKEISDILKKPMGTIAILINRAKKQFKEIYTNEFE